MENNYDILNNSKSLWKYKNISKKLNICNIQTFIPILNDISNKRNNKYGILNSKYIVEKMTYTYNENPYNLNSFCKAIIRENYFFKYYKKKKKIYLLNLIQLLNQLVI